ncbi:MAG: acetate kinase [Oscillospiraceae bacterium]|jgi:acetate kinase|nr:acetate kinase [Oscillospiraceae bacterium]
MKVLAINAGSSSLKYRLLDMSSESIIISGNCGKIGFENSFLSFKLKNNTKKVKIKCKIKNYEQAVQKMAEILLDPKIGALVSFDEIFAIGHRIVHGGNIFKNSVLIDNEIIKKISDLSILAPLHNAIEIETIKACRKFFSKEKPEIAVFDTAFHSDLEPYAFLFPVPYEYYEKYKLRRYGFHGLSHQFVSEKCAKLLGKNLSNLKIISCHLGNGSSVTAIKNSKVVDTTMGLTPLDGLIMGTRCGQIDPSVVIFLQEKENLNLTEISELLNKKSGFLGISGVSSDAKSVVSLANKGHKRCKLACDILQHQLTKTIGSYVSIMNGCDAIVFTAGIGENYYLLREKVFENFSYIGIELDKKRNQSIINRKQGKISTDNSKVDVLVIPTNEELIIARETVKIATKETQNLLNFIKT